MTTYCLTDLHEIDGQWFLPQNPASSKGGRLRFSQDECQLDLIDSIDAAVEVFSQDERKLQVVFGTTDRGVAVTLFRALSVRRSVRNASGGTVFPETLRPHIAVLGAHIDDEQQRYISVRARVPGLLAWRGESPVEQGFSFDASDQSLTELAYKVRPAKDPAMRLKQLPGSMKLSSGCTTSGSRYGLVTIASEGWIELRPDATATIEEHLRLLGRILALLGLVAGPCLHFDAVDLELEPRYFVNLLFRPARSRPCTLQDTEDFFVRGVSVVAELPNLVDAWLGLMPKIETVSDLLEGVLASERLWLHVEFLTLMHVLEGLHRANHEGVYMKPTLYEPVGEALVRAIPACVDLSHRESLKSRIKYGNEVSLARRLGDLAETLPVAMRERVVGSAKGVPRQWVDTRNYYTHWDESAKPGVLDGAALYYANTRLRMLARVLMLRLCGVDDELLLGALQGRSRWAQELIQFGERERATRKVQPVGPAE